MKRFFFLTLICAFLAASAFLAACAPPQQTISAPASVTQVPGKLWPTKGWATSSPQEQGIDPQKLDKALAYVKEKPINLHSLLIIRNGAIVSETYYQSYRQNTLHVLYSVTKSVVSTLVGIAVDQGKISDLNLKVHGGFFPGENFANPDPRKEAMTLENLLTMSSGLGWVEEDPSFNAMYRSRDWVKWMMDLPMDSDPGTTFKYCSGCSHVLSAIVQKSTGEKTEAFAKKNLFDPLGISNYAWEKDANNIAIGGWGLELTPRDMAKFGYLYLHDGAWDGRQVVSAGWVKTATSKHISENDSTDYGYQWWVYPKRNAYAALGRGGQIIFLVPTQNLIIVTTADLPNHDLVFDLIDNYIMPAVQ